MFWLALIGLFILQVVALGKLGLAILPICILWCLAGMSIGDKK